MAGEPRSAASGSLGDRIDRFQRQRRLLAVAVGVVVKYREDRAGSLAALIAYYGFFSLFPLLLLLVTVLGVVLSGNEAAQQRVLDSALAEFPVIGGEIRDNTGRLEASGPAFVVGLVGAVWAGLGVMRVAARAMGDIWDVPRGERPRIVAEVARALMMVMVLGGAVIASAVLTGSVGVLGSGALVAVAGYAAGLAVNAATALFGYRVLTAWRVGLRQLVPGALLAGSGALVLHATGGYLLTHQVRGASDVYGTFAVVLGLLWWLLLQAQVFLIGAELNVVLARHLWPRSLYPARPGLAAVDRPAAQVDRGEDL